jgi:hypothetical protein
MELVGPGPHWKYSTHLYIVPQINTSREIATQLIRLAKLPKDASHEHLGSLTVSKLTPIKLTNLNFRIEECLDFNPTQLLYGARRTIRVGEIHNRIAAVIAL